VLGSGATEGLVASYASIHSPWSAMVLLLLSKLQCIYTIYYNKNTGEIWRY